MNSAETSPNTTWGTAVGRLRRELGRTLQLRRELATLELTLDRRLVRRCVIRGAIGAAMVLVGLPLLLQIVAQQLAHLSVLSVTAWTLILCGVLLTGGFVLLGCAISKFRSDFRGLRDTLAEVREDLIWLREWMPDQTGLSGEGSARGDEAL